MGLDDTEIGEQERDGEDPERPFGGVPACLRWDHGHEFGADAVEQAGEVLGCVSVCCEPYSPWQKGKIERLNAAAAACAPQAPAIAAPDASTAKAAHPPAAARH